jgi:hypothetical protein
MVSESTSSTAMQDQSNAGATNFLPTTTRTYSATTHKQPPPYRAGLASFALSIPSHHDDQEDRTTTQESLEERSGQDRQQKCISTARIGGSEPMLDGNSSATIERLHRQEVISMALTLFVQYLCLTVVV